MSNDVIALLHKVQKELVVPKNRRNTFGNYNYRNCEDILEAIKKILPEGCAVYITDEIKMLGDRFYVCATAHFNQAGYSISSTGYARESLDKKGMDSAQITGAASSYARKYALNGLFAIDDSEDSDSQNNSKDNSQDNSKEGLPKSPQTYPSKPSTASEPISKEEEFEISKMMFDTKSDFAKFAEHYKVKSYSQLTKLQWSQAMGKLKEKLALAGV